MGLFELPPLQKSETKKSNINLKKGQTINSLVEIAIKLVDEKLQDYKNASICVTDINQLITFFNEANEFIGIDTETTGLDTLQDELVGISLCNGKQALYIPINHKSSSYHVRLSNQLSIQMIKDFFGNIFKEKSYKWIYHNAKFDLGVLRTFFGYPVPDPYWDTMLCANLLNQNEEHGLKYLYNKYIAEEDEGVNRFDTLFSGITFDYVPIDIATVYAGKDALMTYKLFKYQENILNQPDMQGIKNVLLSIEMPLLPILEDMQRTGVNMNQEMLKELYDKYSARLEIAKTKVFKEIEPYKEAIHEYKIIHYNKKLDEPINISSPSQLSILFYEILKYKTKSGKGTGVNELKEINTPLTNALLEYRKMEKLIDAFLVSLPKNISTYDNKIHTSLNQYGAATR